MSSKRHRHTSESTESVVNKEEDSETAEEDGGSVKSFGFSAFLQGLSKKRGTRNVK